MTECSFCKADKSDFIARCGHNYHLFCLSMCMNDYMDDKCTVCSGAISLNQYQETLIREFNEGKLDWSILKEPELQLICRSVFEAKRKDFKDVLQKIFRARDMEMYCLYEAASLGHLEAVEWILSRTGSWDHVKLIENSRESKNLDLSQFILDIEMSLPGKRVEKESETGFFATISDYFGWASTDSCSSYYGQVFFFACSFGDVKMLKKLLENGAKIDSEDAKGRTVLHFAAKNILNPEVVDFLVASGAKISEKSHSILCQVDYTEDRCYELVAKLIQAGADANWKNDLYPPVYCAGSWKNLKCLQLFLKNGVRIEDRFHRREMTILLLCTFFDNDLQFIEGLVDLGADFTAVDNVGLNALHLTCSRMNSLDLLNYFLSLGLDINSVDKEGNSALHHVLDGLAGHCFNRWADYPDIIVDISRKKALEWIAILVDHGANINLANNEGLTPIHLLVEYFHVEIFEFLIKNGANINAKDQKGCTLAHMLCLYSYKQPNENFFEKAIELGLDIEALDNDGKSPFDHCGTDIDREKMAQIAKTK